MSRKTKICIIANTPAFNVACAAARISESDLVIATDGAATRLLAELAPDIICGDFDSLDEAAARGRFPAAELVHSSCQETNDLEKCITLAMARGASEIVISCAMGGRLDQTVTTLSLVERYHREVPIVLYEGERTCRVFSGVAGKEENFSIAASQGDTVSLVPRGDGAIVSLVNVRWPLSRERLEAGSRGVSNEAVESVVSLTVHEGVVFFFHAGRD
jgi:thiamine pyrophosphokinase